MKNKVLVLMVSFMLVLTSSTVWAEVISDYLKVYDPTGSIAYAVYATESQELENGPDYIYYISVTGLIDPNQFGNATVLVETSGPLAGQYSDIFGIANIDSENYLAFSSDTETMPIEFGTFPITLPENQLTYDATMYLNPDLQAAGYTAEFWSDSEVPVPGTLLLLSSGLAGLAGLRRKFVR
jgi:hypothetical protein